MNKNFCVSLSSIPSRFDKVHNTIDSILNQTVRPKKIYLNIPYSYRRFPNANVDINLKNDLLEIVRCDDFGPGTKLMGSLDLIKEYNFVIIIDDDHYYHHSMCEKFLNAYLENSNAIYSFYVYKLLDLWIGQGADGLLINKEFLYNNEDLPNMCLSSFYDKYVKNNDRLFLNDDLWMAIYFSKFLRKEIISLSNILPLDDYLQKQLIYKIHNNKDSLLNTYSNDFQEAVNIRNLISEEEYKKFI
jgi:hypothetical protein